MKFKKEYIESIDDVELNLIKEGKLKESSKKSKDYINNKELLEEYIKYYNKKQECIAQGKPNPPLSNKIGKAIIQIANRRCNSRQYMGYSSNWKEELISNAIMTCAIRGHGFDPARSDNPFAYLTQICNNAFKEQLKKYNRELYIKYKSIEEFNNFCGEINEEDFNESDFNNTDYSNQFSIDRQNFIYNYEQKHLTKEPKEDKICNTITIDDYIEDSNE